MRNPENKSSQNGSQARRTFLEVRLQLLAKKLQQDYNFL